MDPCTYFAKDGDGMLRGVLAIHVDDLVLGGDSYFYEHVVEPLKHKYLFKHWHEKGGDFLGKKVVQRDDFSIVISQKDYAGSVSPFKISKERRKQKPCQVDEHERSQMRALLGEFNWMTVSSRPDRAAICSLLQQRVNSANKVEDLIECNKLVGLVRDCAHLEIRVLSIPVDRVEFALWSDASSANASEKKSQGGYFIGMTDGNMKKNHWSRVSPMRLEKFQTRSSSGINLGS